MDINYLSELNSFHDWLITNPKISTSARYLWISLMHFWNKSRWKTEFNLAISALELDSGLSKPSIIRARNILQQYGLITFRTRPGNQSTVYRMIPFAYQNLTQSDTQKGCALNFDTQCDTGCDTQCDTQLDTQTDTILKQNKTRKNMDAAAARASISPVHDLDFGEVAQVWSDTIRPITPFQAEELHDLYKTYGKEQVIWAIQAIPEKQKRKIRSVRYIEAILESRDNGDYHSRQKQPQTAADVYEEMTRAIPQQEDDSEKIAAWMREEGVDLDAFTKSGGHGAD